MARVNIEVMIPRHPDNRRWCLEVDGPGLYSSSCENLAGMTAAFLYTRHVLHLAEIGAYVVRVGVYRAPKPGEVYASAYDVVNAGVIPASLTQ